jgi:tetratricopeptide (TPR) repeat protein
MPRGLLASILLLLALAPAARADGWEFLKQGKPTFARTAFRNQLKKNPDDVRSVVGLGLAELALGDGEEACELLLKALEKDGGDAQARLGLARAFLLRARSRLAVGRGEEEETRYFVLDAENQAGRSAELAPKDPEPCVTLAEARLLLGNLDGAKRAADDAEQRGLERARIRRLRGELSYHLVRVQMEQGESADYDSAKGEIEALVRDDPTSAELRLRLGDLHHATGHWDDALESWRRAFALEPFDRPTLELVLAYLKVPELRAKARIVLETALKTAESRPADGDPRPGYAYFCVGLAKLADHELEEAAARFKKARAVDPTLEVPCSLGLAETAFKSQRYPEASAEWRKAFAKDRVEARTLLVHVGSAVPVARSLEYLADKFESTPNAEARELLNSAVELDPENAPLWNKLAFVCRETGRHEESWKAYSRLIELCPDQPRYLNDAALILSDYLKRDLPIARSLYERAIAAADAVLADPAAPQVTKEMAAGAKTDATSNLSKLPRK